MSVTVFTAFQPKLGVSENSVTLNPMFNEHYPYQMAISLGIYPIFRQTQLKGVCPKGVGPTPSEMMPAPFQLVKTC